MVGFLPTLLVTLLILRPLEISLLRAHRPVLRLMLTLAIGAAIPLGTYLFLSLVWMQTLRRADYFFSECALLPTVICVGSAFLFWVSGFAFPSTLQVDEPME